MKKRLLSCLLLFAFSLFCLFSLQLKGQYVDKDQFAQRVLPSIKNNMVNGNYQAALADLMVLDSLFPSNSIISYYLGQCYLHVPGRKSKAVESLVKAIPAVSKVLTESDYRGNKVPPITLYYLARAYHLDFKTDSAIAYYNRYKKWVPSYELETLQDIDRQIETCRNAQQLFAQPVNTTIENLGPVVNSKYDEYAPVLDALESTLIFTSRREGTTGGKIADDGKYFEDIYISSKIDGKWSEPLSIGPNINTNGHEATISLSADGEQLYIYRDDLGDGNIYVSRFNGDVWGKPVKLGNNVNTTSRETHASISSDNTTLYFTSDRDGGNGGMDIYFSKRLPNGEWGLPTNIGPEINTKYDEEGPFIHPDGHTLFFSSRGHNSIGGFDIFFSNRMPDGKWTTPQNIGYPINSPDDEYFFVTSPDGKRAYFASSQTGGVGQKDLYLLSLEIEKEVPLTVYKGFITTTEDVLPEDVVINVTELSRPDEPYGIYRANPKTGKFILILHSGKKYNISYEAKDYMFYSENLFVPEETSFFIINKEVELKPIKPANKQ